MSFDEDKLRACAEARHGVDDRTYVSAFIAYRRDDRHGIFFSLVTNRSCDDVFDEGEKPEERQTDEVAITECCDEWDAERAEDTLACLHDVEVCQLQEVRDVRSSKPVLLGEACFPSEEFCEEEEWLPQEVVVGDDDARVIVTEIMTNVRERDLHIAHEVDRIEEEDVVVRVSMFQGQQIVDDVRTAWITCFRDIDHRRREVDACFLCLWQI